MSRSIAVASALVVAAVLTGCSSETGILVEIEQGEAVRGEIDTLLVYAGVRNVEQSDVENYRDIESAEDSMIDTSGRDLAQSPYRLLLRRGADLPERGVMVAVIGLSGGPDGEPVAFGRLRDPVQFMSGKVPKWRVILGPLPADWRVTDTGCLIWREEGATFEIGRSGDLDCDGDPDESDCAPEDPSIHHGQIENCENGIDDNCDGMDAEQTDGDDDGFLTCSGQESDCNDNEPRVHPGAEEVCDGLDNDCSGVCDDPFDSDGDDFTTCGTRILGALCEEGFSPDCADEDASRHPGAEEQCDAIDHDCDGNCINGFDGDGDGFAAGCAVKGGTDKQCIQTDAADCNDADEAVHPGQPEQCDGKGDTNCDGEAMPAEQTCYANDDGAEGLCYRGSRPCDDSEGGEGWEGACEPEVSEENQAPQELCIAYDTCESAPDPLACTHETATLQAASCSPTYPSGSPDMLCGQPLSFPLPSAGLQTECSWHLIGGTQQQGYLAGFRDANSGVTGTSNSCDGSFVIQEPTTSPPADDAFLLWLQTPEEVFIYRTQISPVAVSACAQEEPPQCLPATN